MHLRRGQRLADLVGGGIRERRHHGDNFTVSLRHDFGTRCEHFIGKRGNAIQLELRGSKHILAGLRGKTDGLHQIFRKRQRKHDFIRAERLCRRA